MAKIDAAYENRVELGNILAPKTAIWQGKLYTYNMYIVCLYNKFKDTALNNAQAGRLDFRNEKWVINRAAIFLKNMYSEFFYRMFVNYGTKDGKEKINYTYNGSKGAAYQKYANYNDTIAKGFWYCFTKNIGALGDEQYQMFTPADIQTFKNIIFNDTYSRMYDWYIDNAWGIRSLVKHKDGTETDTETDTEDNTTTAGSLGSMPLILILAGILLIANN